MEGKRPTLVIMAAGMGSRFGGLKQIEPVGPDGSILLEYSIYDALAAGFETVVFIVRKENEDDFRAGVGDRIARITRVVYVHQELDDLPDGLPLAQGRTRPWGTGHAVLACRDIVDGPFAVINADDFYGPSAFRLLHDHLVRPHPVSTPFEFCMVGFRIENTLTEHGTVARGICTVDDDHRLVGIHERTRIAQIGAGIAWTDDGSTWTPIPTGSTVSMNMWGFTPVLFQELSAGFTEFLTHPTTDPLRSEFFLPSVVDRLVSQGRATVDVLPTSEKWYGITYRDDAPVVRQAIREFIRVGLYPTPLWRPDMDDRRVIDFPTLLSHFAIEGEFLEAPRYGDGHINDTFAATFVRSDGSRFRVLLQRINSHVFREPVQLMENIEGVTRFLRDSVLAAGRDPERETLNLIHTREGTAFHQDPKGAYWRAYLFIEGARTYPIVTEPQQLYRAGRAFGRFQRQLADYPAERLHETIPDFHDTVKRLAAFEAAVRRDASGRAAHVAEEIAFVRARSADAPVLVDLLKNGRLPLRVTHNDTKFNNVMIDDATGDGICVVDLDTVMPGLSLYDFGDAIRSGASTALEDERDLSLVCMDLTLFEHFTRGFLETAGPTLTPEEIVYLPFAAKLMTFECGMRFLGDHIEGDRYFRIHHEGHNLDRARTQFKLVADMEEHMDSMRDIVNRLAAV